MSADLQLLDEDAARSVILRKVRAEAHMRKMAQIRPQYVPRTEQELADQLRMAEVLLDAEQQQLQKQASQGSPYAAVLENVLGVLERNHYDVGRYKQASAPSDYNQIGASLMADPEIYQAALSLKLAEAQRAAQA